MPGDERITFAVVGHNEAAYLACSLGQAAEARRDGGRLAFVDGQSTDGSDAIAASFGAEVIEAPLGKGRAVAAALAACETPWYSGFRVVRADLPFGSLPPGWAIETHLNLVCAVNGWTARVIELGEYAGPLRPKPTLGYEVGATILDIAEADGRLDPRLRPRWDEWLERVMEVLVTQRPPGEEPDDAYLARFEAARTRPFPPARQGTRPPDVTPPV